MSAEPQIGARRLISPGMSHVGQSLPKWGVRPTSAFPPLPTRRRTSVEVRLVPISDIGEDGLSGKERPSPVLAGQVGRNYCSGVVLVKVPLLPLALIWLLPKETSKPPLLASTAMPLPPRVEAPTPMFTPDANDAMPTPTLSITLDSSTVK
jgi:hypothetical protein